MRCRDCEIFTRSKAGEMFEVMDEVRLIVIAAVGGQCCAWLFGIAAQGLQHMLKTADALEGLGCKAGLFAEELFEMARANADAVDNVLHACVGGGFAKPGGGESYRRMQKWSTFETGKKRPFKDRKHSGNTLRAEQFFAGQRGVCGPDVVERIRAMRNFAGRHAEEGKCAAGAELDADDALLLTRIEQKAVGARAAEDSRRVGCGFTNVVGFDCTVKLKVSSWTFSQIEDNAGFAMGSRRSRAWVPCRPSEYQRQSTKAASGGGGVRRRYRMRKRFYTSVAILAMPVWPAAIMHG